VERIVGLNEGKELLRVMGASSGATMGGITIIDPTLD
jgi:hypothetical protein